MKRATTTENELKYLLSQAELFAIWLYSEPAFNPESGFIRLDDLFPGEKWSYMWQFKSLNETLKSIGVIFKEVGIFNDYKEYSKIVLPITKEELGNTDKSGVYEASLALSKGGGIDADGFQHVAEYRHDMYELGWVEPQTTKEDRQLISQFIDNYIKDFLDGNLLITDHNCLTFQRQKEIIIEYLRTERMLERFGTNFIIATRHNYSNTVLHSKKTEGFFFVYTLRALEHLGYVKILRLKSYTHIDNSHYEATIIANQPLIDEIGDSFRKENPTMIYGGLSKDGFILHFADKEIELSKKKRETDAVLLMKTLNNEPARYWYEDEIIDDWDSEAKGETAHNKVYFAARNVARCVKEAVQVDDFLDFSTRKFRINPKYIKVDE